MQGSVADGAFIPRHVWRIAALKQCFVNRGFRSAIYHWLKQQETAFINDKAHFSAIKNLAQPSKALRSEHRTALRTLGSAGWTDRSRKVGQPSTRRQRIPVPFDARQPGEQGSQLAAGRGITFIRLG
jgi:hypothetical protein